MSTKKDIQNELNNLDSSLPSGLNAAYAVPVNYFKNLPAKLLAKVKEADSAQDELASVSTLLSGLPKHMPYQVPDGYFENYTSYIPQENDTHSTLLTTIGKINPYAVPANYFDGLPTEMLQKAALPTAKVVPMFARKWMKAAAAAVVSGALILAGIGLLTNKTETVSATAETGTEEKLVARTVPAAGSVEQTIKKASTTELNAFIESLPASANRNPQQPAATHSDTDDTLLKDVSVSEMEAFLSNLPLADDDALITD